MLQNDKQETCTHERQEFMSQIIMGDMPHTKSWQECLYCRAKFYEREQFHGSNWQGR